MHHASICVMLTW